MNLLSVMVCWQYTLGKGEAFDWMGESWILRVSHMGGVYRGWGKLSPHEPRLKYECLMKITKAMQLTHNVHNSGTIIPILCYEILSMRLLSCGTEFANLWQ